MKNIWMRILKPRGPWAKGLVLLSLAIFLWIWTNGHFEIIQQYLDTERFTLTLGESKITLYAAVKALFFIVIIFWIAATVSDFSDKRISKMTSIRVANRSLIQKILQIGIYFFSFIITMNVLGINLTSLTVLSGAIGIGLGFGLQKITSNFVSGIILLMERSLEIGDLIELEDGTVGYVRKSSSRATLIETIDGKEVLVPNEEFIIKQVTNWTLSDPSARVTINFGVSYTSDIEKARDLVLAATTAHERTLKDPAPACHLDNFGDSSVDFILYFWIQDINAGFRNIKSEIMFDIWNRFKENDIEIPFPQRDLHIKTPEDLMKAVK